MTNVNKHVPTSTARADLKQAGDALVDQKLVSRKQMNRIFGGTTLTQDERKIARKLVRHAKDEVSRHGLGRAAKNAVAAFESAVGVETSHAKRIEDARTAMKSGAIDEPTYQAMTSEKPGLRAKMTVWAASKHGDAKGPGKAAVDRLAQSTSNGVMRVAKNEKAWGLASFAALIATAVLVPHVTAGVLLAQMFASVIAGGAVSTALRDLPDAKA